jgi:hypothetical protein
VRHCATSRPNRRARIKHAAAEGQAARANALSLSPSAESVIETSASRIDVSVGKEEVACGRLDVGGARRDDSGEAEGVGERDETVFAAVPNHHWDTDV